MVERVAAVFRRLMLIDAGTSTALARAAIQAMREPTEGMVSKGDYIIEGHDQHVPEHAWNVWQAMIDEALK